MTKVIASKKYQDIKTKGKELFWKYGIKRVTIEEICREANVSKMTYYKFFANKNELAIQILKDIYKDAFQKFEALSNSDIPFSEKLKKLFLMKFEGTKNISLEFINDIYTHPDPEITTFMNNLQMDAITLRRDFFNKAQKDGLLRKDLKIELLLAFGDHLTKMLDDKALMAAYDDPQDFIMESMTLFFYGIVNKDA